MRKFFDKAKAQFQDFSSSDKPIPQQNQQNVIQPPTADDVIRYRYHHGVNLGSVFVLEKWLFSEMFIDQAHGDSELDAVTAHVKEHGLGATRQKWETHWENAASDQDWEFLARGAKCTSIRLPIGYFTLGEEFCKGTPFEQVSGVYANAWAAVTRIVTKASSYNIGVLIDLHALPGGANSDAHSGSSTGKPELWTSRSNLERGRKALVHLASSMRGLPGIIGLQLVNEAVHDAKDMYQWYEQVIQEISTVDDTLPIYISDAWVLDRALQWTNDRHAFRGYTPRNPVVIDTHKYYTFSDKDRSQSPQEIIARIPSELSELDGRSGSITDRGEGQVVIGEYSCVLDGQTWSRSHPEEKDSLVQRFGHVQSQKWQEKAGGSYFWTWKMAWMDGGEWGFVEQVKKGNVFPPRSLILSADDIRGRIDYAQSKRQELAANARNGHEGYWNNTSPGQRFEHELYSQGWDVGFSDAQSFFGMRSNRGMSEGGDKIGMLDIWTKKRILESGQRGEFLWEWEQGFRAGISNFYNVAGI